MKRIAQAAGFMIGAGVVVAALAVSNGAAVMMGVGAALGYTMGYSDGLRQLWRDR